MQHGLFIAIEGIDGAGTTTQTARLVAALRARGRPARGTHEPSGGPIGTLIRQALTRRLVAPGGAGLRWDTLALLFAADRLDHVQVEVDPALADGVTVVTDRYDASSLAYQGAVSGDPAHLTWLAAINGRARRPDLTVVLDVSAEVAAGRRHLRGGAPELFEEDALQRRLVAFYATIERHLPGDRVLHLDGAREPDAVHDAVLAAVLGLDGPAPGAARLRAGP